MGLHTDGRYKRLSQERGFSKRGMPWLGSQRGPGSVWGLLRPWKDWVPQDFPTQVGRDISLDQCFTDPGLGNVPVGKTQSQQSKKAITMFIKYFVQHIKLICSISQIKTEYNIGFSGRRDGLSSQFWTSVFSSVNKAHCKQSQGFCYSSRSGRKVLDAVLALLKISVQKEP